MFGHTVLNLGSRPCSLSLWTSTVCSPRWPPNPRERCAHGRARVCTKALLCASVCTQHLLAVGWVVQCVSALRCSCSCLLLLWSLSWEALLAACSSRSLFHPNYIPIIKMLIHTVKGAIKRVIKKALFHQPTCASGLTVAGPLLISTISIMPRV